MPTLWSPEQRLGVQREPEPPGAQRRLCEVPAWCRASVQPCWAQGSAGGPGRGAAGGGEGMALQGCPPFRSSDLCGVSLFCGYDAPLFCLSRDK